MLAPLTTEALRAQELARKEADAKERLRVLLERGKL